MGLFGKGKSGGLMNVIRCDEPEYLVWKWRPLGQDLNSTSRENAIRYGSSLRVKEGEVAVFVYKQNDGKMMDFIMGPHDDTIKTANFPVLSSIVGLAFGGESPFQADIYYINLAGNIQIRFAVPYFDVVDPRFLDFYVPVSVGGTITFNITDYKDFIKLNRMQNFDLDDFKRQVRDAVIRRVKNVVTNAPMDYGYPVVQLERKIEDINNLVYGPLSEDFARDFGVTLKRLDISRIELDKNSEGWQQLRNVTADQQQATINAQTQVNIQNLADTQRINAQNMEETMRIQREETQRAQRLNTETQFIGAHALDRQADVLQTAAQNLGNMSSMGEGCNGGGMNAAGLMTGMAMGGAVGTQMAGMMNALGQNMTAQQGGVTPPPMPGQGPIWFVAVNGVQNGPFTLVQLQQMAQTGTFTAAMHVWKQGMPAWETAGNVPELVSIFGTPTTPPPPPPAPGVPPVPPTV